MKKILNTSIIFLAIFIASPILAADLKIGYVDIAKILNESPAAKAAQKKLEQEFTPRNKQLEAQAKKINKQKEKLKKESDIMSKDQIVALQRKITKGERDLKRDATEAQEDFKLRRRDELGKIENRLKEVILSIAESGNYDLIMTNADVTYASDKSSINITAKVLKKFNSK
tara:strand:- start:1312 stop:1824 length:513 start_codon:yes stop_codon:yes gene_type:complete